ncbi:T-cell ecto-ADP-ribosyltransferase 1-like [Pagrus major]|uniref:T-cell ecto-ADP-ribosyltransferase 1-like n=1 Tax=Pagrus major TaxID=143350 RepID=UPI003CC8ACDE
MYIVCVNSEAVCLPAVMKGTMLIFAAVCSLLCWMQPVGSKKISYIYRPKQDAPPDIKLDMVENAVDDMYFGCNATMAEMVKNTYFKKENAGQFGKFWKLAKRCTNKNVEHIENGDKALTKDHLQAICVYTSGYQNFYETFNAAVRTERKNYASSFSFHSLHFWLTSAVQILSNNRNCLTTYRRSKAVFKGKDKQMIRFGSFTSSSKKTDLTQFGSKTCFKIRTCSGAYLKNYPHLNNTEEEVLIPPYEMFQITAKIKNKSLEDLPDCEVVYVLESKGIQSNLNCSMIKKKDHWFFSWLSKMKTTLGI